MIKAKNIGSSTVYVIAPDMKFHRKLVPGRELPLSQEVYDELTFDPGFQNLIQAGCLRISGIEENAGEIIETPYTVLSRDEIKILYVQKNYKEFAETLRNASPATKESIANLAVEMRIADAGFTTLIKKYCGVDVLEAIARKDLED